MDSEGEDSSDSSSSIFIRKARIRDSQAIYDIHLKSLAGVDRESKGWFSSIIGLRSRRVKILVAEIQNRVAGFIIAYKARNKAYIDYLAVDPQYRGLGVGSKLLQALEETLKSKGVEEIGLSVKRNNHGALQFYIKNGYLVKGVVLILALKRENGQNTAINGFRHITVNGGIRKLKIKVLPTTWWSSLTEYVDRRAYDKLKDELTILVYEGSKLRGLAEFSPGKKILVDYMAVSYGKPLESIKALVEALKREAAKTNVKEIIIPVDGSKGSIIRELLNLGFTVAGAEYRLYKKLSP